MKHVNVTELRQNLPKYIESVKGGHEIGITVRGTVVARLAPLGDEMENARERLRELRSRATVGDVISPIDVNWDADVCS